MKQMLGVNRSTTTAMIRGELNKHSLQEDALRRNIKYAKYLELKEETYYVKQAYNYEKSRDPTKVSFFSTLENHCKNITDITECFEPHADPFKNIYGISDDKLRSVTYQLFHTQWQVQLEQSPKADTYRKI